MNILRGAQVEKDDAGTTLVEVLLYIALVSVIVLAVTSLLSVVYSTKKRAIVLNEVDQQGNLAMSYVLQTIRNARTTTSPTAGASASSLQIEVYDVNKTPTIFRLNGGTLEVSEKGNASSLSSTSVIVSNLTFRNLTSSTGSSDDGTIRVEFTMTYRATDGRRESTYSRTFYGSADVRGSNT